MPHPDALLYHDKYRIQSTRLRGWDYTNAGSYFVTICTKYRYWWFGNIENQTMMLSDIGQIVDREWIRVAEMRPHIQLDRYVIMPNHFHAIVVIGQKMMTASMGQTSMGAGTETPLMASLQPTDRNPNHQPEWQSGCLGAVIQQFKRACSQHIHESGHSDFAWQSRFHDHVIRNESELMRIRKYIVNNPAAWNQDEFFGT